MDIFKILDELNHRKTILLLEKEKIDVCRIINSVYEGIMSIDCLGEVGNLNTIQYLLGRMINEVGQKYSDDSTQSLGDGLDIKDELHRALMILMRRANATVFNHEDSSKNNCLHYCAVLGDYEITKFILESGVNITKNRDLLYAYNLCNNRKTKNMLRNWTKIRDSKSRSILEIDSGLKTLKISKKKKDLKKRSEKIENPAEVITESATQIKQNKSKDSVLSPKISEDRNTDVESKDNKQNDIINEYNSEDYAIVDSPNSQTTRSNEDMMSTNHTVTEEDGYKIVHLESKNLRNKKMQDKISKEIMINKYPGNLYFIVDFVSDFIKKSDDVESVYLSILVNDIAYRSVNCKPNINVDIGQTFSFPIEDKEVNIKISLYVTYKKPSSNPYFTPLKKDRKIAETEFYIDYNSLDLYHNNLITKELKWKRYRTKDIFKVLGDIMAPSLPKAAYLIGHFSYISNEETKYIPAPLPTNLQSLYKWLKARKGAYNFWFKGYVNIRGENNKIATNIWKRRYVKWHGFTIMVFNEHSGNLVGNIEIASATYSAYDKKNANFILERSFRLMFKDGYAEFHVDNDEKYNKCLFALKHLLDE